ncbi:uncharacterized protein LOC119658090 [Hermetia illucens]|uniref:uncharacterized protein LOC119658090 n=1 Tax=Hermetia illucens TaxID=343691 RepID=UPI0018CC1D19|nr:uncharacterized protein LOC119658090 [Hermetia illucens]
MEIKSKFISILFFIAISKISQLISSGVPIDHNDVKVDPIANAITITIGKFDLNTVDFIMGTIELFRSSNQYKILNEVLDNIVATVPVRISDFNNIQKVEQRNHNVLLVKDYGSVQNILNAMNSSRFNFEGFFVIAFSEPMKRSEEISEKIFSQFYDLYILNVIILSKDVNSPDIVDLYTYFPFTASRCHNVAPFLYNRFVNGALEQEKDIFPDKVTNFHQCLFRVVCWNYPPLMDLTNFRGSKIHPEGVDGNMLRILAERLNFTWSFLVRKADQDRGVIFENGTSTGSMKIIIEGDGNFSLCGVALTYERSQALTGGYTYFVTGLVFALRPEKLYSSLYRIFFPFSLEIWFFLAFFFLTASIILTLFKIVKKNYRAILLGRGNHSPFLQMLGLALGNPVAFVPNYNFARTLFILWIITTSVLRTSYQGVLFDFLQKKEYRQSPNTIKEMIDSGHIPYLPPAVEYFAFSVIKNGTHQHIIGNVFQYYDRLYDPNYKGIILYPEVSLQYYNSLNWSRPALRKLPEKVSFLPISILFKKNSFLKQPFDKVIWQILDSGLIDFWNSKMLNRTRKVSRFNMNEPPKITMEDLEGCYRFCSFLLLLGFTVFAAEMLSLRVPRLRRLLEFYTE